MIAQATSAQPFAWSTKRRMSTFLHALQVYWMLRWASAKSSGGPNQKAAVWDAKVTAKGAPLHHAFCLSQAARAKREIQQAVEACGHVASLGPDGARRNTKSRDP